MVVLFPLKNQVIFKSKTVTDHTEATLGKVDSQLCPTVINAWYTCFTVTVIK